MTATTSERDAEICGAMHNMILVNTECAVCERIRLAREDNMCSVHKERIEKARQEGLAQGEQNHHVIFRDSEIACSFCEDIRLEERQAVLKEIERIIRDTRFHCCQSGYLVEDYCSMDVEEDLLKELAKLSGDKEKGKG